MGRSSLSSESRKASQVASSRSGSCATSGNWPGGSSRAVATVRAAASRSASAVARSPGTRALRYPSSAARASFLVTTPLRRVAVPPREPLLERGADERDDEAGLRSGCSSRLQIGQLTVRRLWRQNIGMARR